MIQIANEKNITQTYLEKILSKKKKLKTFAHFGNNQPLT